MEVVYREVLRIEKPESELRSEPASRAGLMDSRDQESTLVMLKHYPILLDG